MTELIPSSLKSPFLFVVCQPGAEPALKSELAREHPSLRFAFSRPGFVTFKNQDGEMEAGFELRSIFARAYGLSGGELLKKSDPSLSDAQEILRLAGDLKKAGEKLRLHIWERDLHKVGEEPLGFEAGQLAADFKKTVWDEIKRAGAMGLFLPAEEARVGDLVLNLVVLEEDRNFIGFHRHTEAHSPHPGGRPGLVLPEGAPSRAYLKLEEGVRWSRTPLKADDIAVEIGSAPGGASYALLQRGIKVFGIDPGEMDPRIFDFGLERFQHIQRPVASVAREELPESIQWLLLDMNSSPQITMFAVDRLASRMKESLLGMLLTIKLNQWKVADEIPGMFEHLRAMGMVRIRATQLPSNKQEFFISALSHKGMARYKETHG